MGPLGPFGVIPKLFRVEGDSERKVFTNGRPPLRRSSGPPQGSAPSRSQCLARSHHPSPRGQRMGPMVYGAPYFPILARSFFMSMPCQSLFVKCPQNRFGNQWPSSGSSSGFQVQSSGFGFIQWSNITIFGDAPNIRHGGVSLSSSFIFEVTAVCSHFGVFLL